MSGRAVGGNFVEDEEEEEDELADILGDESDRSLLSGAEWDDAM